MDLYAPTAWQKMTQRQLRYVLTLLSLFDDLTVVKTYMLFRLGGIHIKGSAMRVTRDQPGAFSCWFRPAWWKPRRWFTLEAWQVESMIRQFDFIDPFDGMDVRLERIRGCRAVDDILDHYPFGDYLLAEQYYQLAVSSGKPEMVERLATFLYVKRNGRHPEQLSLSPAEQMGTLRWFAHVKSVFAERWPHFFRRIEGDIEELDIDLMGAMDAQIRALTEGDITKEETIKALPCWRALTELNQKAREAKEFHEKYDKK
ncbi:MAG: hypothetical protein IKN02_02815 [Prevotella sp.]|nr:hypothetical protein [Prevotella sp.]